MGKIIQGHPVVPGESKVEILFSSESLSFWGGYDSQTGEIIDRRHPLCGRIAAGCILAIPTTRGSSTTTAVLLEAIRAGTAPGAIITRGVDQFLALASVVAEVMYSKPIPIIALDDEDFDALENGKMMHVKQDGTVEIFD